MSNNGWPNDPYDRVVIRCGGDTAEVRGGDVAVLLKHLGDAFHKYVEPVVTFNGYRSKALNDASGGIETSNHRSATAVDINGYEHRYEATLPASQKYSNYRSGFTPGQVVGIRNILNFFEGTIKWGEDFSYGWRDPMHFEIQGNPTQVARIANKIRALNAPPVVVPPKPEPAAPPVPKQKRMITVDLVELINSLFRKHLKRNPAPQEVDNWVSFYAEVNGDLSKLWHGIANSQEAINLRN